MDTTTSPRLSGRRCVKTNRHSSLSWTRRQMPATLTTLPTRPTWPSTKRSTRSSRPSRPWRSARRRWARACSSDSPSDTERLPQRTAALASPFLWMALLARCYRSSGCQELGMSTDITPRGYLGPEDAGFRPECAGIPVRNIGCCGSPAWWLLLMSFSC